MSRRAPGRHSAAALALIAPLALGLLLNFVAPIAFLLTRAWEARLPNAWPRTAAVVRDWDGSGLPNERIVTTLTDELRSSYAAGTLSSVANRLNYDRPGLRGLLFDTGRVLSRRSEVSPSGETRLPVERAASALAPPGSASPTLTSLDLLRQIDPRWAAASTWAAVRHAAGPISSFYLLAAVHRRLDSNDTIVGVPPAHPSRRYRRTT